MAIPRNLAHNTSNSSAGLPLLWESNLTVACNVDPFHLFFQSHWPMFISLLTKAFGRIPPFRHFRFCVQIGSLPNSPEARQSETVESWRMNGTYTSSLDLLGKAGTQRTLQLDGPLRPNNRSWDSFLPAGEPYSALWMFHSEWRPKASGLKNVFNSSPRYAERSPSFCC